MKDQMHVQYVDVRRRRRKRRRGRRRKRRRRGFFAIYMKFQMNVQFVAGCPASSNTSGT